MRLIPACTLAFAAVACLACGSISSAEDLRLPSVFGSHMVLQRDMPVPVWGWADPGEQVSVKFRDQVQTGTANSDGQWSLKLDPLALGKAATLSVTGAGGTIEFEDVLVGEVWVCSGQSNMQWTVDRKSVV